MGYTLTCPKIIGSKGKDIVGESLIVSTITTDTHTFGIAPGSFLVDGTTEVIACGDAGANAKYICMEIMDAAGNHKPIQYLTTTELGAANYKLSVIPIGGLEFEITEDALVTPITDANIGGYADLNVTEPADTTFPDGIGQATPNIKIDSDTINASSTGLLIQVLRLSNDPRVNAYSATAGASPRTFVCKVIDAVAQASI